MIVESSGHSHLVGLRFTALGAWRFFHVPMEELRDRVIEADLVLGRQMLGLRAELLGLERSDARLRRLAEFVLRRIDDGPRIHSGLASAIGLTVARRGDVSISELVALASCSHRHLVQKFREQVGVGPKRFGELLRLQRAAETLKRAPTSNLADLALSCGYYDQSHFNRSFRQFAGVSPGKFIDNILPDEVTESMIVE
jgi:AraC-like DNA-binding protein